jgi:DNA-nicking Smr family endonuclease
VQNDTEPQEIVELEITDVLDLHSFPPQETAAVVESYLEAVVEKGYPAVRIIHGRGRGVQRRTIRSLLSRHPRVTSFTDAPGNAGGWGATLVTLQLHEP